MIAAREAYRARQATLDAHRLVFLDESAVKCSMNRLYGWAKKGKTPLIRRDKRGRKLNLVGAIGVTGPRAYMAFSGSFNSQRMLTFIHYYLGPTLREGDIVVMDGLSVHKVAGVQEAIESYGATVLILPPYSPELNPIEHAWSTLKARLRAIATPCWDTLCSLIPKLWSELEPHCMNWVRHCGYTPST